MQQKIPTQFFFFQGYSAGALVQVALVLLTFPLVTAAGQTSAENFLEIHQNECFKRSQRENQ